jgi:hypothetical protein
MDTHNRFAHRMAQVGVARFLLFVSVAGGCASADPVEVRISQPTGLNVSLGSFARVLVAGFIPNGIDQIDLNWETVRLLQVHLRTKDALTVIASEPLPLMELARSSSRVAECKRQVPRTIFSRTPPSGSELERNTGSR